MTKQSESNPKPRAFLWAGLDIAKATFHAAAWGHMEFRERHHSSFQRTYEGASDLLRWLRETGGSQGNIALVMETTGVYSEELATWLLELDPTLHISIVNTRKTSNYIKSLDLRNKTDDQDARALAGFGHDRYPMAWQAPSKAQAQLRDLVRTRTDLVHSRVAMHLRVKDHPKASEAANLALERVLKTLDVEIERLDKAIAKQVKADAVMSHLVCRMTSIKGIGLITAATVLGELGNLMRFTRSRQLTAFAGMSPRRWESGTSVKGKTHLCRKGSSRLRAALFMAAKSAVQFNPDMAKLYANLTSQGKHHMAAMGAVMRKLLILMRAVLKADRDWQPAKP